MGRGNIVPDVLQCPYCALRFTTQSELEQHQAFDHPEATQEDAPKPSEPTEPESAVSGPVDTATGPSKEPEERGSFFKRLFRKR
jgi:hypothetical protein